MSTREIAAAAAKKYILSTTNTTASAPPDRFHSVMALITLGKAEEAENINREKFLQAILTELFIEHPVLVVPEAITDPQPVIVTAVTFRINGLATQDVLSHIHKIFSDKIAASAKNIPELGDNQKATTDRIKKDRVPIRWHSIK